MTSPDDPILITLEAGVATITLNRPAKLNAMTIEMDRRLNELAGDLNRDDAVRVIILTGAGDRAFSAGSDLTSLDGYGTPWQYRNRFDRGLDYANAVWRMRKPVINAVHGYCIGGGLEMACASDIRYATRASSFGAGEIRWGWHGGSGATQFLTKLIGPGAALEMLLTGERIDAAEAHRVGLVQKLFDNRDDMMAAINRLATTIGSYSPIPVEAVKSLVRVAQTASFEVGLAYENDLSMYEQKTADAAEGRAAFAEKRTAVFRGE